MSDRLTGLVEEQHAVRRRLLDHVRVRGVALRPRVGVLVVRARDQAGEVGLLVAGGGGGVVEGEESDGDAGDGDEEAGLEGRGLLATKVSSTRARGRCCCVSSRYERTPKLSEPPVEEVWEWSPAPWEA